MISPRLTALNYKVFNIKIPDEHCQVHLVVFSALLSRLRRLGCDHSDGRPLIDNCPVVAVIVLVSPDIGQPVLASNGDFRRAMNAHPEEQGLEWVNQ